MAEGENSQTVPLNIVLRPDSTVANWAMTYSYRVTRHFPAEFNLDTDLYKAHLSLVHGEYSPEAIPKLTMLLEGIAAETEPFQVEVDQFVVSPKDFLHWKATQSKDLMILQRRVLEAASSAGTIIDQGEYNPHITLTKLKDPSTVKPVLASLGKGDLKLFQADSMAVMDLGSYGTVSTLRVDIPFLL